MDFQYYALHFHMKSGGVKIVIENIIKGLKKYSKIPVGLIESGKQFNYKHSTKIKHIKISEIDYSNKSFSSYKDLYSYALKIAKKLEKKINLKKKCIIHAHNANIFKNTYLTTALKILTERNKNLLLIMQVHDFAEDHREDLLKLMKKCTKKDKKPDIAFPISNNIIYFTINSRDKRLLKKVGIPHDRIFVYPNSINTEYFTQKAKITGIKKAISKYAKINKYNFSMDRKILIYPVKTIRRKNITEAILILKLLNSIKDEYQLLISLNASTKLDIKYQNQIDEFIKSNNLLVTIGFGHSLISSESRKGNKYIMPDIFSISKCILTTSKLEGFGFAFIEGWLANRQVVGRRLNFIMEDFEKNNITFPGSYNKIIVNNKDFKDLPLNIQLKTIKTLDPKTLLKQKEIKKLIFTIKNPTKSINSNKKEILKHYSLKGYTSTLLKNIKKGFILSKKECKIQTSNTSLINYFNKKKKKIIITDMDGCFLDYNDYSYKNSIKAYQKAKKNKIPIIICTSKSLPEIEYYNKKLKNKDPFISENGSAIYIPKKYFSFNIKSIKWNRDYKIKQITTHRNYLVIELNAPHKETYSVLKKIQKELSFKTHIYSEHSIKDLKKYVRLPASMAKLSLKKYFADGVRFDKFTPEKLKAFSNAAKKYGFNAHLGGRFIGINKGSDKGKATQILIELFEKEFGSVTSYGLGDNHNDLPMLKQVDFPYIVGNPKRKVGIKEEDINIVKEIGPIGWSKVVNAI